MYVSDAIIKPGTLVRFKKEYANIRGVVKAVWIGEGGIQYMVAYLNAGELRDPYVPKEMFEIVDEEPIPAGFRLNSPPTFPPDRRDPQG